MRLNRGRHSNHNTLCVASTRLFATTDCGQGLSLDVSHSAALLDQGNVLTLPGKKAGRMWACLQK
jgi:hypothetical protein